MNHQDFDIKQHGRQGLVSFSVADGKRAFPLDDIAPVIIHHHAKLQFLELMSKFSTTDTRKMMDAMQKESHVEFKHLKILHAHSLFKRSEMDTAIQPFCDFVRWVIERAPHLHTVILNGFTMNHPCLKALANSSIHLRHVDFQSCPTRRPDDNDILVAEFLRDHVAYMADKGGSRLESLKIQLDKAHPTLIDAM